MKLKKKHIEAELKRVQALIEATSRETHYSTSQALCRAADELRIAITNFDSDELSERNRLRQIEEERRLCTCGMLGGAHSRECAWSKHIEARFARRVHP